MTCRLVALFFDANDPIRLAQFWADALRWQVDVRADGVAVVPTDHTRFRLDFVPARRPKVGQNPIHLDLTTTSIDDQNESVARVIERGGSHIDIGQTAADPHVVLADPEGNEFCVIEPTNNFLAGCERLGAINCVGSPQVGYFWSAVFGWPLVWDQDDETAIREPDGTGPFITWGAGIPATPRNNRLHLRIAPMEAGDQRAEVDRLVTLGATRVDDHQGDARDVWMADPDGIEFCVLGAS